MRNLIFVSLLLCLCYAQEIVFPKAKIFSSEKRIAAESFGFKLDLAISKDGRLLGKEKKEYRQLFSKEELILAAEPNFITKMKVIYRQAQADKRLPISGKEYILDAQQDDMVITYKDGRKPYIEQEVQIVKDDYRNMGKTHPFSQVFEGKTFTIGQEIKIPEVATKALLGEGVGVKNMLCTLKETCVVSNKKCAILDAKIEVNVPLANVILQAQLSGEMAINIATSEVIHTTLLGPLEVDNSAELPNVGKVDIKGTGTMGISLRMSFDGILGCIDTIDNDPKARITTVALKASRWIKHRDSKMIPADAHADVLLARKDSENVKTRTLIAALIGSVGYKQELADMTLQYLQDERDVMKATVDSCSRQKELLQPQVVAKLKELYEVEVKKAKPERLLVRYLKKCIK